MGKLILILGGARSGKSTYAEQRAKEISGDRVLYVASAEAIDPEMQARAEKHQARRPSSWRTLEARRHLAQQIQDNLGDASVVLVDCITVLTANIFVEATG